MNEKVKDAYNGQGGAQRGVTFVVLGIKAMNLSFIPIDRAAISAILDREQLSVIIDVLFSAIRLDGCTKTITNIEPRHIPLQKDS